MSFDWGAYLPIAVELAARDGDEAAARSAIGRAYYAALGRAASLLRSEGRDISPLQIHGQVGRAFRNNPDARRSRIGLHLNWLRDERNRADYVDAANGDASKLAREAVLRARIVLRLLDGLRSPPA